MFLKTLEFHSNCLFIYASCSFTFTFVWLLFFWTEKDRRPIVYS